MKADKRYSVVLTKTVKNELEKFPKNLKERFHQTIRGLADNPFEGERLTGKLKGMRSLRVGHRHRLVYKVEGDKKQVIIIAVGPRGKIYNEIGRYMKAIK